MEIINKLIIAYAIIPLFQLLWNGDLIVAASFSILTMMTVLAVLIVSNQSEI